MRAIIGLGNPGREYKGTRHNIGYMCVDVLAEKWNIDVRRRKFHAVYGEGAVAGVRAALVKPTTFMNASGLCVTEVASWYKLRPEDIVVVYDDFDLPLGSIRIREGGSAGTHNGMRSVIYQLGYDDFPRIRVGIGHADGQKGAIAHVLGAPTGEEAEKIRLALLDAADAVEMLMNGRIQEAQARFNKKGHSKKRDDADAQNV